MESSIKKEYFEFPETRTFSGNSSRQAAAKHINPQKARSGNLAHIIFFICINPAYNNPYGSTDLLGKRDWHQVNQRFPLLYHSTFNEK
jgi:hypothetical protein